MEKFFNKLIIFRPHNVYGPNMGNKHVIPQFINRLKKKSNKNFNFFNTRNRKRNTLIYIY